MSVYTQINAHNNHMQERSAFGMYDAVMPDKYNCFENQNNLYGYFSIRRIIQNYI